MSSRLNGRLGWRESLRLYSHPRVIAMLFLGFSAGLPILLVFSTLSTWLREARIDLGTIGLLSYVLTAYSVKVFWAPVVDRFQLPVLSGLLGRRRSWMLVAQVGIAVGFLLMAQQDPARDLQALVLLAFAAAFCSATQDIVVDAWRIEAAPEGRQDAMAVAYQLGYRIALLVAGAGALWIADESGWAASYQAMAALAGIGIVTTLLVSEPEMSLSADTVRREARVVEWLERKAHWPDSLRELGAWFIGGVVCPFVDFFQRNGAKMAIVILAFIGCFRLTDITMGVIANPFYIDMGYTKKEIALVVKGYGVLASIAGIVAGGAAMAWLGLNRSLLLAGALVILSNVAFGLLAMAPEQNLIGLALVVSGDNFSYNVAGTAFIAYLSGLTNKAYTATQYALFSSMFTLPGKILGGASGFVAEALGYPLFFVYTSALGIPALLLLIYLTRQMRVEAQERGSGAA